MYGLQPTVEVRIMADDEFKAKPSRPHDTSQVRLPGLRQQVLRQAGKAGMRGSWSRGHLKPSQLSRGMGVGLRARAGIVAPEDRLPCHG